MTNNNLNDVYNSYEYVKNRENTIPLSRIIEKTEVLLGKSDKMIYMRRVIRYTSATEVIKEDDMYTYAYNSQTKELFLCELIDGQYTNYELIDLNSQYISGYEGLGKGMICYIKPF